MTRQNCSWLYDASAVSSFLLTCKLKQVKSYFTQCNIQIILQYVITTYQPQAEEKQIWIYVINMQIQCPAPSLCMYMYVHLYTVTSLTVNPF